MTCIISILLQSGCPYFSPTGLNGGWQWKLEQSVAETSCTVEVTFVDFYDPFSSPLTQTVSCMIPRKHSMYMYMCVCRVEPACLIKSLHIEVICLNGIPNVLFVYKVTYPFA